MRGIILTIAFCAFGFSPAHAQTKEQQSSGNVPAKRVVFIEDQEAGALRIVIDGREVARIDASGLHVREGISYGGALTDYSAAGFDTHAKEAGHE